MKQRTASPTTTQQAIIKTLPLGVHATLDWNEVRIVRFIGTMQPQTMLSAISDLQVHHVVLASQFRDGALEFSVPDSIAIEGHDFQKQPPVQGEAMLPQSMHSLVTRAFGLEQGSLFRAVVISLQSDEHVIGSTANHVTCDGWFFRNLQEALGARYRGHAQGHPTKDALIPAPDFSSSASEQKETPCALRQEADPASLTPAFCEPCLTPDLPTGQPGAALRSYAALREDRLLNLELIAQLKAIARRQEPSLLGIRCAAYCAHMARETGNTALVVAISAAAQFSEGMERLVGHCISYLPHCLADDFDTATGEQLTANRHGILDACEHKCVGLEVPLERFDSPFDHCRLPVARGKFGPNPNLKCVASARHRVKLQKRMSAAGAVQRSKYPCSKSSRTWIASVASEVLVKMMLPQQPPISLTEPTMGLLI